MPKIAKKWLRNLVGLHDSPHKIALGLALGIFVGFVPIMGIQMAAVLPFALLFRGNKTAAIAGVWITNPVTFIPIYYLDYRFGLLITPYHQLTRADFANLIHHISFQQFLELGQEIVVPLFVGGGAIGVLAAFPTYFVTRVFVTRHRQRTRPPDQIS